MKKYCLMIINPKRTKKSTLQKITQDNSSLHFGEQQITKRSHQLLDSWSTQACMLSPETFFLCIPVLSALPSEFVLVFDTFNLCWKHICQITLMRPCLRQLSCLPQFKTNNILALWKHLNNVWNLSKKVHKLWKWIYLFFICGIQTLTLSFSTFKNSVFSCPSCHIQ